MKKIASFIILLLLAAGAYSCDMDKQPRNQLPREIQSVSDANSISVGLYSKLKGLTTGAYYNLTDFQTDLFHATATFGNFRGVYYQWSFQTTDADMETMWYGWYNAIAQANYLIEGIDELRKTLTLTEVEEAALDDMYGSAHWIRAYSYYNLAIIWCDDYNPSTAASTLGLMLATEYDPSSDVSTYLPRSPLSETFKRITDDLDIANTYIEETANEIYISKDAIAALKARVALYMRDWPTAISQATSLINSDRYALISDQEDFDDMWENDNGDEIIFKAEIVSSNDGGNSTGLYFIYNQNNGPQSEPQYIPEQWVLDLYDPTDIRFNSYFREETNKMGEVGTFDLYLVWKYPGNPALKAGAANNYRNKGKIFRIAEMYLIAAEAYQESGQEAQASALLNELKANRIPDWETISYSGSALQTEIRNERTRELFAEGVRFPDLKRWGLGFTRGVGQYTDAIFQGPNHSGLSVEANNPRFVWPIPKKEMDVNPHVKDQQNPGYTN